MTHIFRAHKTRTQGGGESPFQFKVNSESIVWWQITAMPDLVMANNRQPSTIALNNYSLQAYFLGRQKSKVQQLINWMWIPL
jgi:hypothetical protein